MAQVFHCIQSFKQTQHLDDCEQIKLLKIMTEINPKEKETP